QGGSTVTALGKANVAKLGHDIQASQTATPQFWNSWKGQALIASFNGGPNATALSAWLATTFGNLFGARAGAENVTGKTNAQVAAFFQQLFGTDGRQL